MFFHSFYSEAFPIQKELDKWEIGVDDRVDTMLERQTT